MPGFPTQIAGTQKPQKHGATKPKGARFGKRSLQRQIQEARYIEPLHKQCAKAKRGHDPDPVPEMLGADGKSCIAPLQNREAPAGSESYMDDHGAGAG